jgi:hypothetical protein
MGTSNLRTLAVAITAVALVVVAYAPTAHADRRSSLGGNLLIQDQDDVFVFPHLAPKYVRTLSLDLGLGGDGGQLGQADRPAPGASVPGSSAYGSGGIILGDESLAVGIFVHRGDIINNLPFAATGFGDVEMLAATNGGSGTGTLPGVWPRQGMSLIEPISFLDAVVGMGDSNFGLRLSLGLNTTGTSNKRGDDTDEVDNTTFIANVVASYGLEGEMPMDLALEIGFASQSFEAKPAGGDATTDSSTNLPSVSLLARGYSPMAKGVELGFIGLIDFRSGSDEFKAGDADPVGSSNTTITALVGAGPVYTVKDKFQIASYAAIGVGYDSADPQTNSDAKDDESSTLSVLLPQLKLSGEFYATDWLVLRAGMEYAWALVSQTQQMGEDNEATGTVTAHGFRWISGIGLDFDELQINGVLNPEFALNGPYFIGGTSGTFVLVNLSYDFN